MQDHVENRRPAPDPWHIGFGVVALTVALLTLLVWIPNDIKGGFIENNQIGKPEPGDAFFPVILAGLIALLSVGQLAGALFGRKAQPAPGVLTSNNLKFIILFYAFVLIGLTIMYWLGPLVVEALRGAGVIDNTYRQLTDTAPYKYLGFVTGGFLMTLGLIVWAEGCIRPQAVWTVVLVIVTLIVVLDVMLHNIQLPPNADF